MLEGALLDAVADEDEGLRVLAARGRTVELRVRPQRSLAAGMWKRPRLRLVVRERGELSLESLARAYSDDEPEYSLDLIKEANPEYEGR